MTDQEGREAAIAQTKRDAAAIIDGALAGDKEAVEQACGHYDVLHHNDALADTADASELSDERKKVLALKAILDADKPLSVPLSDYAGAPIPKPVIWRHDPMAKPTAPISESFLSIGEVAILTGAGGLGKSTVIAALLSARSNPNPNTPGYVESCGLASRPGPSMFLSYEDVPARVAHRFGWYGGVPSDVHVVPDAHPLWQVSEEAVGASGPGPDWDRFWRDVRSLGTDLVVIDPIKNALAGVSVSEDSPVRTFLRALTAEAAPDHANDWQGCGVLLVGHSTKSARNALASGEDPNAGVIGGSASWYDGARGVLSMFTSNLDPDTQILQCVKSNYGPHGWGAALGALGFNPVTKRGFRGLAMDHPMEKHEVRQHTRKPKA